jgi:hypothetical protein
MPDSAQIGVVARVVYVQARLIGRLLVNHSRDHSFLCRA